MVATRTSAIQMQSGVTTMPVGPANVGTDLSDDHPISFTYNSALVAANGELRDPATLTDKVRLDHDQQMQCTSCHDPHDNRFGKFLVKDNTASALCVTCHTPNYWQDSSHRLSNKLWNGTGINPWPHTSGTTVAANGCENCHAPHTAGTKPRLLNFADEEMNCFSCHAGTVAAKNIQAEFNKFSAHPILRTTGIHDPMENPINSTRHVECADCHNPHASKGNSASAPLASGALAGVKGVNASGAIVNPVVNEYELCFRCHADSVARGPAQIERQISQTNKRIQFDPANASYHPIESTGKNPVSPSLIPPLTPSSRIYCTDCHNSDQSPSTGNAGPNGPHGSIFTPILERELILKDGSSESFGNYALCYKCHDRNSILGDQSFRATNADGQDRGHRFHIVDQKAACSTCHDAHGVATQARLINFDRGSVTNSISNGRLEFVAGGPSAGNCSLTCHGADHSGTAYPVPQLSPAKRRIQKKRVTFLVNPIPKIIPKPVIIGFFVLGLLSSVAFRAIILFQKFSPGWVRPIWYFGVIGYMLFFMYRYSISLRRKRTIRQASIVEKLKAGASLSTDDRNAVLYLLSSVQKSPEDWNYLAIFILSIVAIALDLLLPGK